MFAIKSRLSKIDVLPVTAAGIPIKQMMSSTAFDKKVGFHVSKSPVKASRNQAASAQRFI